MGKEKITKEAEALLEKYYEGLTTVAEEKRLHDFLSQKDLPVRFDADRALLKYFAEQKIQHKTRIIPFLRWASVAAAFLIVFFTTETLLNHSKSNYVYIDGKRFTNVSIIKDKALASIKDLAESPDEVKNSAKLLEDNENLMEQQLSLFSDLN